jgi:hypothetical protein
MAVISGGTVIAPQSATANPGTKQVIYRTAAVPTDTTIGVTPVNGMLAENTATGFVYERQAGVWVRIDTI